MTLSSSRCYANNPDLLINTIKFTSSSSYFIVAISIYVKLYKSLSSLLLTFHVVVHIISVLRFGCNIWTFNIKFSCVIAIPVRFPWRPHLLPAKICQVFIIDINRFDIAQRLCSSFQILFWPGNDIKTSAHLKIYPFDLLACENHFQWLTTF